MRHVLGAFTSVCVVICLAEAAPDKPAMPPEQTALEFISAMLVERNMDKATRFFDKDAEREDFGKGSAVTVFGKEPLPTADKLTIKEITFFRENELPELRKRFAYLRGPAQFRWERLHRRTEDGLACLLVAGLKTPGGEEEPVLIAFLFKNLGGRYRIVYVEDN